MKELSQNELRVGRERRLIERAIHQRHPAVAGALVEPEGVMPHPQSRMTAGLFVTRWAAEAADQELPEPQLGAGQVVFRIHRPEHAVSGHLGIERRHEPGEPVFANPPVDIALRKAVTSHQTII